jgi:hypothetical protein
MATPGQYPMKLYRGDTYRWQFVLRDDEGKTQPTDLTGVVPKAEIRDKPSGAIKATIGCTITAPNIIDAVLLAADCALLPAKGAWDLQLTYADGDVATVLAGTVDVTLDVTDSTVVAGQAFRVSR